MTLRSILVGSLTALTIGTAGILAATTAAGQAAESNDAKSISTITAIARPSPMSASMATAFTIGLRQTSGRAAAARSRDRS